MSIAAPIAMRFDMRMLRVTFVGTAMLTLGLLPVRGQPSVNPNEVRMTQQQQDKLLLADRQKRMMADTDRLAVLVDGLKTQMSHSTPGAYVPVDMIKKADEIERLAHDLKNRLKGGN
jgi:hypothetical protein